GARIVRMRVEGHGRLVGWSSIGCNRRHPRPRSRAETVCLRSAFGPGGGRPAFRKGPDLQIRCCEGAPAGCRAELDRGSALLTAQNRLASVPPTPVHTVKRYLPWLVATVLFMEQLDSTIV